MDNVGELVRPRELRLVVYRGGVEPQLRKVVWKHLLGDWLLMILIGKNALFSNQYWGDWTSKLLNRKEFELNLNDLRFQDVFSSSENNKLEGQVLFKIWVLFFPDIT